MSRVLAIDYGDARTGVSVSDPTGLLAGYTEVIPSRREEALLDRLAVLVRERDVGEIVVGLPRNMDGTEGPRAQLCRDFAARVGERLGLPVELWDERRTSVEAHAILHAGGKREKQHRKTVDAVAASLILEGFLLSFRRKKVGKESQ